MEGQCEIAICQSTRRSLQIVLLWPWSKTEKSDSLYKIQLLLRVLIKLPIILLITHLIIAIRDRRQEDIDDDLNLLSIIGCNAMAFNFVKNQSKTWRLMANLSKFDRFGKPDNYDKTITKLNKFSHFAFIYLCCGTTYYCLICALVQRSKCDEKRLKNNYQELCGLSAHLWFPYPEFNDSKFYFLFIILMIYFLIIIVILGWTFSFHCYELCQYIVLHIEHLNKKIMKICEGPGNYETRLKRLKHCIEYHLEILGLVDLLQDSYKNVMFIHVVMTGLICGCVEYQLLNSNSIPEMITPITHVSGWILSVFVACLAGQQIINASETIPESIYNLDWEGEDVKLQKMILLFLMKSQKELQIKTGDFGYLSFPTFVSIIKLSYSIFTLLSSE